jgi:hypothetical protein
MTGARGQASVETVALVPVILVVALACVQLLLAGLAHELAGHAAEAGAVAAIEGVTAPADAARDALPGWSRSRLRVTVSRDRVEVHVSPPTVLPGLAGLLGTTATAKAAP